MPTDEWFKENPKVSAYISKELYERLEEWMSGQKIKKVSQALTQILEEYLGLVQSSLPVVQNSSTTDVERIEALEGK